MGWVIAVFGNWLAPSLFTDASEEDWRVIKRCLITRRQWIIFIVNNPPADVQWMFSFPLSEHPFGVYANVLGDRSHMTSLRTNQDIVYKKLTPCPGGLPCWRWCGGSCCLDALLVTLFKLSVDLLDAFDTSASTGPPVARQLVYDMRDLRATDWAAQDPAKMTRFRDKIRDHLIDRTFVSCDPFMVDGGTALDKLDTHLMPRDVFDWTMARQKSCPVCSTYGDPSVTSNRGLDVKIPNLDEKVPFFASVQEIVVHSVCQPAYWANIQYNEAVKQRAPPTEKCLDCGGTYDYRCAVVKYPLALEVRTQKKRNSHPSVFNGFSVPVTVEFDGVWYRFVSAIMHTDGHWESTLLHEGTLYSGEGEGERSWSWLCPEPRDHDTDKEAWVLGSEDRGWLPSRFYYVGTSEPSAALNWVQVGANKEQSEEDRWRKRATSTLDSIHPAKRLRSG
jgi:hypothetical protein